MSTQSASTIASPWHPPSEEAVVTWACLRINARIDADERRGLDPLGLLDAARDLARPLINDDPEFAGLKNWDLQVKARQYNDAAKAKITFEKGRPA